jgi:diaminopimelate epimerase
MTAADRMPHEQRVPFVKATACGNDFLIVDGAHATGDMSALSQRMCDRHNGIGADGVEWLFSSDTADIRARLFNADGSEAEISGNGTRCVAAYLCAEKLNSGEENEGVETPPDRFTIQTGAGIKSCQLIGRSGSQYEFEIAMGEARVGAEISITIAGSEVQGTMVDMGNPHYVVFVREYAPGWQATAAEIGRCHHFKHGINVELVIVRDKANLEARFFERGVGETQSSGTGSCASAVAAIAAKRAESPVQVHAPGGVQTVRWEEQVFLRGWARLVGQGDYLV